MDFGRENSLFPLILIQVKSAAKRTVFGLKDKREKAFLPFKTQLFHIQVVRYAAEKYKVNAKWVWTYTRQHKVPKVRIRQFNYYSKKHIDAAFAKYEVDSDLTEWYTPEEIQEKYGMTRVAIRSQVYRNNIPSKKEHGQIFYSKLHFDLSKSSEQESKVEYYTVKEAMEKFKLSRDSVYGILQFHQINREKNGRFVRFLKVEFDRVMGVRK